MAKELTVIDGDSPGSTGSQAVWVGPLDSLEAIRVEQGRLYRAARRAAGRDPSPADAARLAFVLNTIGKSIELELVRREVAELKRVIYWRKTG